MTTSPIHAFIRKTNDARSLIVVAILSFVLFSTVHRLFTEPGRELWAVVVDAAVLVLIAAVCALNVLIVTRTVKAIETDPEFEHIWEAGEPRPID